MANNTPVAPLYDDNDINAVYQAIKSSFDSVDAAWQAAIEVTSVVTNRLIQKRVDEDFQARVDAWHDGPHFPQDESDMDDDQL